jgi:plastocyanin
MGKQITVNVNRQGTVLKPDPESFDLLDGDWVQWQFWGLNQGEFGFISFDPSVPKFGPFHSLRSLDNASFLGKGNTAVQTKFTYQAMILNLNDEKPAASGSGTINNRASNRDTAPDVTVAYESGSQTLIVSPDPVGLNVGDTATWWFVNTPANSFACFQFDSGTADGSAGPFVAFSANGGGGGSVQASGMGFVTHIPVSNWPKSFTYRIQLRNWDGTLLASHDPVIDNLGPPAPS